MRKGQQKQILELLQTLDEVRIEIKRFIAAGDAPAVLQLLIDAAGFTEHIKKFIDNIEGEGTAAAKMLEELGDAIVSVYNGDTIDDSFNKFLIKSLAALQSSVRQELKPNKIEAAFFPYKASMADSFESIWLAMKDDPMFDVYVVPVPYRDYLPNREPGPEHYEGHQYPDYMPIVKWESYDVEARRPDVVFIHNPYDESNVVTCVHPKFQAQNLAKFTDMLVYVPYFVATDVMDKDSCVLAGTIYADKVFLQSEGVRRTYIEEFKKFTGKLNIQKSNPLWDKFANPEDKFVALGSPKFDKVTNAKPGDFTLPEEWQRLIYSDGEVKKKVILYNTRYTDISIGIDNMLKKLRHVLEIFKNHENMVLWWRPHPHNISCLQAMRPRVLEEYLNIVNAYKSEGWGIYDDTADLHRAIAFSDAYYGDWSSVVTMYSVTGKPVITQDNVRTDDRPAVRFADFAADEDGGCWGFCLNGDGLFELDFNKNTARLAAVSGCYPVTKNGRKSLFAKRRYVKISAVDDKIICFPHNLDNILVYNRKSRELELIPLDRNYLIDPSEGEFLVSNTIEYKDNIYLFGLRSKAVAVFNCSDNSVSYGTKLHDWAGLKPDIIKTPYTIFTKYPIYLNVIPDSCDAVILMRGCEHLILYSLETQEINILASNTAISKCAFADFDGTYYWLIKDTDEELIRWNSKDNSVKAYTMPQNKHVSPPPGGTIYSGIADCGSYLLILPSAGHNALKFDKESGQFSVYYDLPVPDDKVNTIYKYHFPKRIEHNVYAFAHHNCTMYELNIKTGEIKPNCFVLSEESREPFLDMIYDSLYGTDAGGYEEWNISEQIIGSGLYFLEKTAQSKSISLSKAIASRLTDNTDGTAGVAIREYIRGHINK